MKFIYVTNFETVTLLFRTVLVVLLLGTNRPIHPKPQSHSGRTMKNEKSILILEAPRLKTTSLNKDSYLRSVHDLELTRKG